MSILYLVLEDFRGVAMAALCGAQIRPGRPCASTPALDALASEGVLFERAFAQSPICNPSRTSTMTGRYPSATGVLSNDDDGRTARTLPNLPQARACLGLPPAAAAGALVN
jgi:arylsulfatase A-like enzyme